MHVCMKVCTFICIHSCFYSSVYLFEVSVQVCIYLNRSRVWIYTHLQPVDGAQREVHTRFTPVRAWGVCIHIYIYWHLVCTNAHMSYVQAVEGADRSGFGAPGTQPQISRKLLQPGAGLPGMCYFPSFFLFPSTTAASGRWNRANSFSNSSKIVLHMYVIHTYMLHTHICYTQYMWYTQICYAHVYVMHTNMLYTHISYTHTYVIHTYIVYTHICDTHICYTRIYIIHTCMLYTYMSYTHTCYTHIYVTHTQMIHIKHVVYKCTQICLKFQHSRRLLHTQMHYISIYLKNTHKHDTNSPEALEERLKFLKFKHMYIYAYISCVHIYMHVNIYLKNTHKHDTNSPEALEERLKFLKFEHMYIYAYISCVHIYMYVCHVCIYVIWHVCIHLCHKKTYATNRPMLQIDLCHK